VVKATVDFGHWFCVVCVEFTVVRAAEVIGQLYCVLCGVSVDISSVDIG